MNEPTIATGETVTAHEPEGSGSDGEFTIRERQVVNGQTILFGDFKPEAGYGRPLTGVFAGWDLGWNPGDQDAHGTSIGSGWCVCSELETITG